MARILTTLFQDTRFALRQLRKHPAFSLVAVLTLAAGIAASTVVFSLVDAVILRPLPFPQPDRLISLDTAQKDHANTNSSPIADDTSWPDFFDWREHAQGFQAIGAYHYTTGNIGEAGAPVQKYTGSMLSAGMSRVLGMRMGAGRDFLPSDELAGNRSIILSDELWQTQFAGAADVLGKQITLNEETYTVVGILPRGFVFPGQELSRYWLTEAHDREGKDAMAAQRGWHGISVIGRLRDGVSLAQATAQLSAVQAALAKQYPESNRNDDAVAGMPLARRISGDLRQPMHILLAAVGFLLLIACVNVAGLLLTRSVSRQGELAVRSALGATRAGIVRQLLLESLTLSLAGGAVGTVLAAAALRAAPRLLPANLPHAASVGMDARVLLFAFAISLLTGLLFGVLPAWRAFQLQPAQVMAGNGRSSTMGRGRHRLHGTLVIAETALSLLLLVGAGLLLRSFQRVLSTDPGFQPSGLLSFRVAAPDKHFTHAQQIQFAQAVQQRLTTLPGVQAATAGFPLPLSGGNINITFTIDGRPTEPGNDPVARVSTVVANFFSTLRIPLLRGRFFTSAEDTATGPQVLVINQTFADLFFPGESPVGKHIRPGLGSDTTGSKSYEIVGVVGNVKRGDLTEPAAPEYYMPLSQTIFGVPPFALRTTGDPLQYTDTVRKVVAEIDPALPVFNVYSYDFLLARTTAMRRFQTVLLTGFAALALLLAAIGLYASLSYMVVERTAELGLRMALGAQRGDVLSLILCRGLTLACTGLCLGLLAAFFLTRYIGSLLYSTRPLDLLTFTATTGLLLAVCALSSALPALRAARLDPANTLRQQ